MGLRSTIVLSASLLVVMTVGAGCATIRGMRARQRLQVAEALFADEDFEEALAEFQSAAELDPQSAIAHSRMGVIYRRMGDYESAIDAFVEAVRRNPFSFDDAFDLARLYHFTKRLADAVQAYLHAVDLEPNDFDAQLNLGVCYQQMGDHAQAVESLIRAIAIDPDRPHAYVNLGVAYHAQGQYYEAVRAYKEALERDSRQPLVLVNLANTYMKQNRLKTARHTLEQALRMDPTLAPAHEALGYCRFQMREYDQSEAAYQDALAYDSRLPRSYAGLGSINKLRFLHNKDQQQWRERALEYWHRSLEIDPDQARVRRLIARYQPSLTDPLQGLLTEGGGE